MPTSSAPRPSHRRGRRHAVCLAVAGLVTATLVLIGGGTVADAARPATCATKGTTTLHATPRVRVYSPSARGPLAERDLYACLRPAGRSRFLFDGASNETSSNVRIVGDRFVSVADLRIVPIDGAHETSLLVVDLKTGRQTTASLPDPPRERDFTLLADGSMVYVERPYDERTDALSTTVGTLVRVPFGGAARQELDSGAIGDLASSARSAYWTKDGVPQARRF
ncbi:hypothetical protein DSM112329_00910 [Paraconexibacter sp. AEG42_29]|uniref:Uncharacterized protein n=1 Tax=Paraconexibacter sp. AEG42_29 TaxID=2997339 RepID=A0AAU7AR14_9ACTN